MSEQQLVTWWTPAGFAQEVPSEPFAGMQQGAEVDWYDALEKAGYRRDFCSEGDAHWFHQVWSHKDGHLYVSLVERTEFLVGKAHAAAFWVTLHPSILAAEFEERRTLAIEKQANALTAWVRHGHGERVVGEDGTTLEQRRRDVEAAQCRRAERNRSKA